MVEKVERKRKRLLCTYSKTVFGRMKEKGTKGRLRNVCANRYVFMTNGRDRVWEDTCKSRAMSRLDRWWLVRGIEVDAASDEG